MGRWSEYPWWIRTWEEPKGEVGRQAKVGVNDRESEERQTVQGVSQNAIKCREFLHLQLKRSCVQLNSLVLIEAICFPHETQFRSVHLFHSFFTNRLKRQKGSFWFHPSIHDGFELGKNQKEISALKKLKSMSVKAKSAKQFKEWVKMSNVMTSFIRREKIK